MPGKCPSHGIFDTAKPTALIVDVSPAGLGAMLAQDGKVVSYASRSLSDVETRYARLWRYPGDVAISTSMCTDDH